MADLLIRDVDGALRARLASLAAAHGRSLEDEAREVLRGALSRMQSEPPEHIADLALRLFGPEHGVELHLPPRAGEAEPLVPDFRRV